MKYVYNQYMATLTYISFERYQVISKRFMIHLNILSMNRPAHMSAIFLPSFAVYFPFYEMLLSFVFGKVIQT